MAHYHVPCLPNLNQNNSLLTHQLYFKYILILSSFVSLGYSSAINFIRVIKPRRMSWARQLALTGKNRKAFEVLAAKSEVPLVDIRVGVSI
jgi:hypothetical protein